MGFVVAMALGVWCQFDQMKCICTCLCTHYFTEVKKESYNKEDYITMQYSCFYVTFNANTDKQLSVKAHCWKQLSVLSCFYSHILRFDLSFVTWLVGGKLAYEGSYET